MQTSYFGRINSKNFRGRDLNAVSIARSCRYWSGKTYPPLFPTFDMINMQDPWEYEKVYTEKILSKLDPLQVWLDLGEDAILLCHESAAKCESGETFCHRHIVARWLEQGLREEYGWDDISIQEMKDDKQDLKQVLKTEKKKSNIEQQELCLS